MAFCSLTLIEYAGFSVPVPHPISTSISTARSAMTRAPTSTGRTTVNQASRIESARRLPMPQHGEDQYSRPARWIADLENQAGSHTNTGLPLPAPQVYRQGYRVGGQTSLLPTYTQQGALYRADR
ncbi:uncharacterized protein BCR38DRAFT_436515 [Pseudomassariella vexata]|uniref:Uncharacterized protein n=1 Tax=Pseudomassariella vexata TaxID=1141098 RepID=A0A1Y2DVK3_9PEZI|nr:uncharacterized protein BCR38DRAFT_436515 [Pseudomassariella vexata]ORY63322.1 hypothetical protein BCR38DRAFT_436515 [Pseudomassariella vexata]